MSVWRVVFCSLMGMLTVAALVIAIIISNVVALLILPNGVDPIVFGIVLLATIFITTFAIAWSETR